jgi:hypothetical protein
MPDIARASSRAARAAIALLGERSSKDDPPQRLSSGRGALELEGGPTTNPTRNQRTLMPPTVLSRSGAWVVDGLAGGADAGWCDGDC